MLYVAVESAHQIRRVLGLQCGNVPWDVVLKNLPQEIGIASTINAITDYQKLESIFGKRSVSKTLLTKQIELDQNEAILFLDLEKQSAFIVYMKDDVVEKLGLMPSLPIIFW